MKLESMKLGMLREQRGKIESDSVNKTKKLYSSNSLI
jgi:hypothetical protein